MYENLLFCFYDTSSGTKTLPSLTLQQLIPGKIYGLRSLPRLPAILVAGKPLMWKKVFHSYSLY